MQGEQREAIRDIIKENDITDIGEPQRGEHKILESDSTDC